MKAARLNAERNAHVGAGREDLAAHQARARHRQAEQRLQGSAFPFPRSRIDGQIQSAHQDGEQHEVSHEAQHHDGTAGGGRHVDVVDRNRDSEQRIDAPGLQPQLSDGAGVACDHRPCPIRRSCGFANPRCPRPSSTGAGVAALNRAAYSSGMMSTTFAMPCADGGTGLVFVKLRLAASLDAPVLRDSRVSPGACSAPRDRELERLIRLDHALIEHARHHESEQQGPEQGAEQQRRQQRAPIAQVLQKFLAEHREKGAHSAHPLRCRPAPEETPLPSEPAPLRSRIDCTVASASTLPWPMITTRSQSAATSCMTCEENKTQRPCALSASSISRKFRIAMTSSPLVGSSSTMLPGS